MVESKEARRAIVRAQPMRAASPRLRAIDDASEPIQAALSSATILRYHAYMNAKHRRPLEAIFARPVPSDIRWVGIESLLVALGAERSEGRGARVQFLLDGEEAVFHGPHPRPETNKGAVASVREFLKMAGVEP